MDHYRNWIPRTPFEKFWNWVRLTLLWGGGSAIVLLILAQAITAASAWDWTSIAIVAGLVLAVILLIGGALAVWRLSILLAIIGGFYAHGDGALAGAAIAGAIGFLVILWKQIKHA